MTEQPGGHLPEADTEGHFKYNTDAEQAEGDDVEGHKPIPHADAERPEGDTDTEGHWRVSARGDAERDEDDADTEGHGSKHR